MKYVFEQTKLHHHGMLVGANSTGDLIENGGLGFFANQQDTPIVESEGCRTLTYKATEKSLGRYFFHFFTLYADVPWPCQWILP